MSCQRPQRWFGWGSAVHQSQVGMVASAVRRARQFWSCSRFRVAYLVLTARCGPQPAFYDGALKATNGTLTPTHLLPRALGLG